MTEIEQAQQDAEYAWKNTRAIEAHYTAADERQRAELAAEREKVATLEGVLARNGFTQCDIAACNCGSWHPHYGLPERMCEINDALVEADVLDNSTGNLPLNAIKKLHEQRDALRRQVEVARIILRSIVYTDEPTDAYRKSMNALSALSPTEQSPCVSHSPDSETQSSLPRTDDTQATTAVEVPVCVLCGKPAACLGAYENDEPAQYACDDCCGHGNEDGYCSPVEPAKVPAPAEKPSYDELVTQEQSNACDASYERYLQNLKGAPRVHSEAFRAAWFQSLKNNWGATTLSTGTHDDLIRAEGQGGGMIQIPWTHDCHMRGCRWTSILTYCDKCGAKRADAREAKPSPTDRNAGKGA